MDNPFGHLPLALQSAMQQPHVHIRDAASVAAKLLAFIEDGNDALSVIADFDHTLSRAFDDDGCPCGITHGAFDNKERLPEVVTRFAELSATYGKYDMWDKISAGELEPLLEEWWQQSHQAILGARVSRDLLETLVKECTVRLRDGAPFFFDSLESAGIPLVIFSAGIGNVISSFLMQHFGRIHANIDIISNTMLFDDNDEIVAFSENILHSYNKSGSLIPKDAPLVSRKNIILIGDALGDGIMADGIEGHNNDHTIKIGFSNKKQSLLSQYKEVFDIVIVDDQSLDVPNAIIKSITK